MCPECPENELIAVQGGCKRVLANCECLCGHVGNKAFETEDIKHAGEVVAERHQAPFAANLVEATNQEVAVSGPAFDGAEGVLDEPGTTAHQFACASHPCSMTFENIFVLPAPDGTLRCLPGETTRP